jgi:hypothetical protein
MSTIGGSATHRGRKRAPQAGRADVRQGGFAHFGQHKHRAAHAEWAKQRAVAGFVDACVEEGHGGEGTGYGCKKGDLAAAPQCAVFFQNNFRVP